MSASASSAPSKAGPAVKFSEILQRIHALAKTHFESGARRSDLRTPIGYVSKYRRSQILKISEQIQKSFAEHSTEFCFSCYALDTDLHVQIYERDEQEDDEDWILDSIEEMVLEEKASEESDEE